MLAAAMAPAIVRASSLMKIAPGFEEIESGLIVPRGNQLLTISQITERALKVLSANVMFVDSINKSYDWNHGTKRIRIAHG